MKIEAVQPFIDKEMNRTPYGANIQRRELLHTFSEQKSAVYFYEKPAVNFKIANYSHLEPWLDENLNALTVYEWGNPDFRMYIHSTSAINGHILGWKKSFSIKDVLARKIILVLHQNTNCPVNCSFHFLL